MLLDSVTKIFEGSLDDPALIIISFGKRILLGTGKPHQFLVCFEWLKISKNRFPLLENLFNISFNLLFL
jgi:hypothetical protein